MAKKIVKPVDTHVGALVRKRRTELGLSQEKLAEAISVTGRLDHPRGGVLASIDLLDQAARQGNGHQIERREGRSTGWRTKAGLGFDRSETAFKPRWIFFVEVNRAGTETLQRPYRRGPMPLRR